MSNEQWRTVAEFPNYAVSDKGRVKRLTTKASGKAGAILSQYKVNGYPSVNLLNDEGRRSIRVHRLVAEAFIDRPEGTNEVNHIDADRANNRVGNLEWVTSSGNRFHAYRVGGLRADGERNGYSKLTDEAVRQIRSNGASSKAERAEVGRAFGVSGGTVRDVLIRRTWAHVV